MKKLLFAIMLLAGLQSTAQVKSAPNKVDERNSTTGWTPIKRETVKKGQYQCWGTCKNGKRCSRKVSEKNGYCYQHKGQVDSAKMKKEVE